MKQGTSGTYGDESLPNFIQYIGRTEYVTTTPPNATITYPKSQTTFAEETYSADSIGYISVNPSLVNSVYKSNAKVNPDNAEILYVIKF